MSAVVISNNGSLPRDIDVIVNVSKPQIERVTDFSVVCFATPNVTVKSGAAPFTPGPGRIRYYTSLAAVQADFAASSEPVRAATDFFAQSPRAKTMAIGAIFTAAQAGFVQGGIIPKTINELKAITDGSFKISIDSVESSITGVTFASVTDMAGVASALQTKIRAVNSGGFTSATVEALEATTGGYVLKITSGTTGASSSVSGMSSAGSGTFLGDNLALGLGEGMEVDGYDAPASSAEEIARIKEAAVSSGKFVYGWAVDKSYRNDKTSLVAIAEWAESQEAAIFGITTNDPLAMDATSESDIGITCKTNGYRRTFVTYHNNPYYYPEIAILAYALHVNYSGMDTTITTKFKDLFGIPTVPMTVSQLEVLNDKRINTFTLVGNSSRTFREGTESNESWFMDDLINLDNFREYLQVAVFNVFLQNKKVPYNDNGVNLLRNAMIVVCDQFVKNGTLSERPSTAEEKADTGTETQPAYTITFKEIFEMTAQDRMKRVGPPANIVLNLAGAIHSIEVNVEAYA